MPRAPAAAARASLSDRWIARAILALAFLVAGVAHIVSPGGCLKITPGWVPWPEQVVLLTGLCEIAGAIGLMTTRFRRWSGIMLALYTVCVFPANINHALNHIALGGPPLGWWYHGPRLAFQPVIVWWCLYAGGVSLRRARASDRARGAA